MMKSLQKKSLKKKKKKYYNKKDSLLAKVRLSKLNKHN